MPHKHKRRNDDSSIYDLPPTVIAKPLPVRDPNSSSNSKPKGGKSKDTKKETTGKNEYSRTKSAVEDDTPRAFRQLMKFQTQGKQAPPKPESGESSKKRKRDAMENKKDSTSNTRKKATPTAAPTTTQDEPKKLPKILSGEKLSDFAARVDRELPMSGMKKSGKPASSDLPKVREERRTKHEKHLRRLQRMWREEEVKIREREAAEREEREEEMEEELARWKEWETEAGKGKAKKKGAAAKRKKKGKKYGDEGDFVEDNDPDPWAKLKKKDRMNKPANPFDVVQAPPQLTKPREVFKVRGGAKVDVANVPAAVGSLRRREELASERRNIVEEYRRLMAQKRQ